MVKNLTAIKENWVQSLGWQDPLEEGMATHFSIPAKRIPWTEEPGGRKELDTTKQPALSQGSNSLLDTRLKTEAQPASQRLKQPI